MDAYLSFLPAVPEYHEVPDSRARDEGNTHKTSYYDTTMKDSENINKNEHKTWSTIYEAIYSR